MPCTAHAPAGTPAYSRHRRPCLSPCPRPARINLQVDGGNPLLLDGDVVLCARGDDPAGRHFDGRLAYLSLYDVPLHADQVE